MDKDLLVEQAQRLTELLDKTDAEPKAVMLVEAEETGNLRLWIVPRNESINKQEFYRIVAETISLNEIVGIEVGLVELATSTNPAMQGMGLMMRMEGIGSAYMSNNVHNGVLLPSGVVIRMEL